MTQCNITLNNDEIRNVPTAATVFTNGNFIPELEQFSWYLLAIAISYLRPYTLKTNTERVMC